MFYWKGFEPTLHELKFGPMNLRVKTWDIKGMLFETFYHEIMLKLLIVWWLVRREELWDVPNTCWHQEMGCTNETCIIEGGIWTFMNVFIDFCLRNEACNLFQLTNILFEVHWKYFLCLKCVVVRKFCIKTEDYWHQQVPIPWEPLCMANLTFAFLFVYFYLIRHQNLREGNQNVTVKGDVLGTIIVTCVLWTFC